MKITEYTSEDYKAIVKTPFTVFDFVEFCKLNEHKVDDVKYLVFSDEKNRFGLIAGMKDGVLKAPFSAPYACFSEISPDNKIISYSKIAGCLADYAKEKKCTKIRITLPPTVYDEGHIAKLYNSFYVAGFKIAGCDLNFQYDLAFFDDNYEMSIDPKARQKLRASIKNGLTFEKTEDIKSAYEVIKANRESKNYPLWMSYQDIIDTIKVVMADFFIVKSPDGAAIASALVYRTTGDKVQVIYWGNLPDTDHLKPMNFLACKIFDYYNKAGKRFFDIGPSTEFSIPNFGLCDFKQSIGCSASTKFTFELEL